MKCTAPIRGHRAQRAKDRCPSCRRQEGRHGPRADTQAIAQPRLRSTHPSSVTIERPANSALLARKTEVERRLIRAGLDALSSEYFVDALSAVALELYEQEPQSPGRRRAHWLCMVLAEIADAIDPSQVAAAVGNAFEQVLIDKGMPDWAAIIAGKGIAKASVNVLSALTPEAQLCLGLRVLAALQCPQPDTCPEIEKVSVSSLRAALNYSESAE